MKRAILVALALVVAITPVAIAYAGYGPVTEVPARLDDVQAP